MKAAATSSTVTATSAVDSDGDGTMNEGQINPNANNHELGIHEGDPDGTGWYVLTWASLAMFFLQ